MIPEDRNWILIHIQKTGGNSIRTALGCGEPDDPHKHFLARDLRPLYGEARWQGAFKFAFVRNPWDRLVSWWSMIDGTKEQWLREHSSDAPGPNKFTGYVLQRARTFEDFVRHCTDEIDDEDGSKYIFRNQIDYLADDSGAVIVDFVGRFERLQQDFNVVMERLGLPRVELPRVNASRHGAYMNYYSPALADAVGRLYARDVDHFGYRFGD